MWEVGDVFSFWGGRWEGGEDGIGKKYVLLIFEPISNTCKLFMVIWLPIREAF